MSASNIGANASYRAPAPAQTNAEQARIRATAENRRQQTAIQTQQQPLSPPPRPAEPGRGNMIDVTG